jgi:NCAIR mutase (PurE)-related protein
LEEKKAKAIQKVFPKSKYYLRSKVLTYLTHSVKLGGKGTILVITAGTTDIPVAEEAAVTAQFMGNRVETLYDVGVAGIHRLLSERQRMEAAQVLIVVAGMEGALPSVVGGLVDRPVIAVPTSVGYGTSFGGITALLAMLNSCASGIAVVNIDNGFGAGYMASLINRG